MPKLRGKFVSVIAISFVFTLIQAPIGISQESVPTVIEKLEAVEKKIKEGKVKSSRLNRTVENLRLELIRLKRKKVKIAGTIRDSETHIFNLETEIQRLRKSKESKLALLGNRWKQVSQINSALIKLSLLPPLSIIAYPKGPSDLVRAGILYGSTVPQIEKRAHQLRNDLLSLDLTQTQIAKRKQELSKATAILDIRKKNMEIILNSKMDIRQKTLAAKQVETTRLRRLAREAKDLRELFIQLNKERLNYEIPRSSLSGKNNKNKFSPHMPRRLDPNGTIGQKPPLKTRPISTARGKLTFPVIGRINQDYGNDQNSGVTRRGIRIESSPGAQVVTPYNGRIVFAGPFRGYGRLLIIEHGRGYHSLLAGMARIDGSVGQWLLSGEPVAVMGKPLSGRPNLYMEFRVKGQPVNPTQWLTAAKGKINR